MGLTHKEELTNLFKDGLNIAGLASAMKSALRNSLNGKDIELPPPGVVHDHAPLDDLGLTLEPPTADSTSLVLMVLMVLTVLTVSTVSTTTSPKLVSSQVAVVSLAEYDSAEPVWRGHCVTTPKPLLTTLKPWTAACTQIPTPLVPRPPSTTSDEGRTNGCSRDIQLTNPTLTQITSNKSHHSSSMFRYIKFMISQDSYYLGEVTLNHYRLHSGGFSTVPFSVPPNPQTHNPEWWYAVTRGRAVGIFPTW